MKRKMIPTKNDPKKEEDLKNKDDLKMKTTEG